MRHVGSGSEAGSSSPVLDSKPGGSRPDQQNRTGKYRAPRAREIAGQDYQDQQDDHDREIDP
jgi:hypothetical protein